MRGPYKLNASTGLWERLGFAAVPPGYDLTNFVPGRVEPSLDGQYTKLANCGVRYPLGSLTVQAGTVHASGTTVYNKVWFTGQVIIDSGSPTFTDCFFSGTFSGSDSAIVDSRAAGVTGAVFTHCHFVPAVPSGYIDAIIGHHYTADRCVVHGTCDGFGVYNTNAGATDAMVTIQGCYVRGMSWWYPDPTSDHTDGTHNDCIQHQGQNGLWVLGNSLHGYVRDMTGNITSVPNPSGSSPNYNQAGQLVVVQLNTGSVSNVHINDNWLYGSANGIAISNTSGSGYTLGPVECLRNKWMDAGMKKDGSHQNFIRTYSTVTLNGATYASGSFNTAPTADGNVWGFTGNDAFGVAHSAGDPITYRIY